MYMSLVDHRLVNHRKLPGEQIVKLPLSKLLVWQSLILRQALDAGSGASDRED